MKRSVKPSLGTVRLIAGTYGGRRINFPAVDGLRPTTDQIRETLFNWLAGDLADAKCLDCFAGSGALGLEALSRGAGDVTFIDNNRVALAALKQNLLLLDCEAQSSVQQYQLPTDQFMAAPYDVIFLDPPFKSGLLDASIAWLEQAQLTKPGSLIYLEFSRQDPAPVYPAHWHCLRDKKISRVRFCLLEVEQH